MQIKFEERPMTDEEYTKELEGFKQQSIEFGNHPDNDERLGFVATEEGRFIGASSGLVQKNGTEYGTYFYLSDLYVEKNYRKYGYGRKLLELLERKAKALGVICIWTWTASFEASTFYMKHGYDVFTEFKNYYPSGHSRVGLIKKL